MNGYSNGVDTFSGPGDTLIQDVNSSRTLDFSNTVLTDVAEIDAAGGHDTIVASNLSNASYRGGSGNDALIAGNADVNWLFGGSTNGFDTLSNGNGETNAVAESAGTVIGIDGYSNGVDSFTGTGDTLIQDVNSSRTLDFSDTVLTGIAEIDASGGHDTITASNLSNANYRGGSGNDSLNAGNAAVTWLFVGVSNGFDTFVNGTGATNAIAESSGTVIGVNGYSNGVDSFTGSGDTLIQDVNSSRTLDFGGTVLVGIAEIDASGGHDTIIASNLSHDIRYSGGAGNDSLLGGAARDILDGGSGTNTLFGGASADHFVLTVGATATVQDFDQLENDKLDISSTGITNIAQLTSQTTQSTLDADGDGQADDIQIDFGGLTRLRILDQLFGDLEEEDFLWSL